MGNFVTWLLLAGDVLKLCHRVWGWLTGGGDDAGPLAPDAAP